MLPRGWAALAVLAVLATTAQAQVSDELGIERFRIAVDRHGIADVEWADVPAHLHWDAGLLVGFAHAPLVLYDRQMNEVDALVERRLSTTLVGAVGLYDRLQLAVSADVVGYQSGFDGSASPTMKSLPGGGLGDLRLLGKAKLAGDARYQVALLATLTAPAGSSRGFLREAGVTFAPALALSVARGQLRGGINVGYLLRKNTETAGLRSDDEGFVRVGGAVQLGAVAELFAAISAAAPLSDPDQNQIALELLGGASRSLTPAVSAFVAGGVGLDNGFGTPDWRVLAGVRFGTAAPTKAAPVVIVTPTGTKDSDGDGVDDARDRCAKELESRNGFRDGDGCPEAAARIVGRVVDPNGVGIAAATIVIAQSESGSSETVTTDGDGHFAHAVLGGAITLTASAPEYQDGTAQIAVEPGASGTANITLVRKVRQGQLRGQVLSFDGKPLPAKVTVSGKGTSPVTVTADAEGNYTVELPGGTFQVEITAAGYKPQKRNVNVKLDGVTVLNVDLRGGQ